MNDATTLFSPARHQPRLCLLLITAMLASLGPALAEGGGANDQEDKDHHRIAAYRGWYLGAGAGVAHNADFVEANDDGSLSSIESDRNDVGVTLFGGYSFGYFGLEAGYRDHGTVSFDAVSDGESYSWSGGNVSTSLESDGYYFGVRGQYPMAPRWTLFATVGVYAWKTTETFTESFGTSTDENSGSDITYGAGVEYDLGKEDKWALRSDFTQDTVDDDEDAVSTVGASAVYRF